jgi:hypothetical protein
MTLSDVLLAMCEGVFAKDRAIDAADVPPAATFYEAVAAVRHVLEGADLTAADYDVLEAAARFLEAHA